MLVRFCVVGVIHCLFFFSYGNASFGYYIIQHRMCQKATYSATTKICEMSEFVFPHSQESSWLSHSKGVRTCLLHRLSQG